MTLIKEEALLFVKNLRDEIENWVPRKGLLKNKERI